MQLHTFPGAISPARVKFFLAEKGVDVPCRTVNLMAGEHKTPEYRKRVRNSRVPALELDDGETLCETTAICLYLDALHPEPPLLGTSPLERARIEMWNRMMELELMLPMAMAFRHLTPAMKVLEDQVPEFGAKQKIVATKRIQRLEKEIAGRDYIVGNTFSVADITAWCSFKFFRPAGFAIDDTLPNLQAWFERIKARPAATLAFT